MIRKEKLKRKISIFTALTFILSLVLSSLMPGQVALAKINFTTTLKVNGNHVDIKSKVELKPGNRVDFRLDYSADSIDPKPKEGDEFKFTLPKVFKDIVPEYPKNHFKNMKIEKNPTTSESVVVLTCGPDIESAIGGFLTIGATVDQVEVEEPGDMIMAINGVTIKIDTNTTPPYAIDRLIYKEIKGEGGNKPNYTINPNSNGEIIGKEIQYSVSVNEKYIEMKNAKFEDVIPGGMELVKGSVIVKKYINTAETNVTSQVAITDATNLLSISLGNINHKYIIGYKVKIKELKQNYINNAKIIYGNNGVHNDSVTVVPKVDTPTGNTDVDKSIVGNTVIDPNNQGSLVGKKVSYKIIVNDKKQSKNNAILEDIIPIGMKLLSDTVKIYKEERGIVQDITAGLLSKTNKENNLLKIQFGNITTRYRVEYQTEIIDDKEDYKNNAKLTWDGGSSEDSTISKPNKPQPGTGKLDKKVNGNDNATVRPDENGSVIGNTFNYSILVNDELGEKKKLVLVDKIPEGMELQTATIKVSKDVGASQYMDVTSQLAGRITKNSNLLKIEFGDTKDRYKVEYQTKIKVNKNLYNNVANLTWDGGNGSSDNATVTPEKPGVGTNTLIKKILWNNKWEQNITISPNNQGLYTDQTIDYAIWLNDKREKKYNTMLKDKIPSGMELVRDSISVFKIDAWGEYKDVTEILKNKNKIVQEKNQLKIYLENIEDKYTVNYKTKITEYKEAGYENNAELTWNGGYENDKTKVEPIKPVAGLGNLDKKVFGQDDINVSPNQNGSYVGKQLNYSILVNNELTEKANLKLEDNIPAGMKLLIGTVKVSRDAGNNKYEDITAKNMVTIIKSENKLKIEFGTTKGRYKVEYKTEITEDKDEYKNGVKLTWDGGSNNDTSTITPNKPKPGDNEKIYKTVNGQEETTIKPNSSFAGTAFDYRVLVNDKLVQKNNAILTDNMPKGMELIENSVKVYRDAGGGVYVDETSKYADKITKTPTALEIKFGDIKDRYWVTYRTKITELIDDGYKNTAVLAHGTDGKEEASSTVKVDLSGITPDPNDDKLLNKTAGATTSISKVGDKVKYTVNINGNNKRLLNLVFEDKIPEGMKLLKDGFKVIETKDNGSTGDITKKLIESNKASLVDSNLTINFGDTYSRYKLEYTCEVKEIKNQYRNEGKVTAKDIIKTSQNVVKYEVSAGGINATKTVDKSELKENDNQEVTYSIKVWSNAIFPTDYLNIEDKLDGRLIYKDCKAPDFLTVSYDEATKTVKIVNKKDIPPADKADAAEVKIKVSFENVKAGETVQNVAKINDSKTTPVEVKKGYKFEALKVDGDDENKPLEGAKFKLYKVEVPKVLNLIPIGKETLKPIKDIVSDTNGLLSSNIDEPGTYVLKEFEAPNGYDTLEGEIRFEVKKGDIGNVIKLDNIVNHQKTSSIKVMKVDEKYSNVCLRGAEFTLKGMGDTVVSKTTGDDGVALFKELKPGNYTLEETRAPEGYIKSDEVKSINVEFGLAKEYLVQFTNKYNGQELQVKKVDKDDQTKVLKDAEFTIKNEAGKVVRTIVTEENGLAKTKLPIGRYTIEETKAPERYVKSEEVKQFEVKEVTDIVLELLFTNTRIKGTLEISKKDVVDGKLLPNAEFVIKNSVTGKEVVKDKTNGDGLAKFTLEYGKYTYQEISAPEGYVLDNKEYPFEIKENGEIVKVTMTNDRIRGILEISKTDVVDGKLLPNAEFVIKNSVTGKEAVKGKTDEKGLTSFKLEYGQYTYQEIAAPEGYVLDNKEYPFEIKENGEIVKATMTNDRITGTLEISKTDVVDGKLLPNAEFVIKNVATGKVVVKDKTNGEGLVKFTLEYGKYTYQEVAAPEGFVLDNKEYPFEIKENREVVKATMTNDRIRGILEISKTDVVDGKLLPNAEFVIKNSVTGKEVVKGKTDEKGIVKFTLEYGKYTYQETSAPEGYIVDSKEYPFQIKENGEVVKATMTNDRITGTLEISKTDVVDGKLLPNAEFVIKDLATGKEVVKNKTNEKGLASFKLEYGKYTYQEIVAPEGYVLDNKEYPFEIKENGEIVKAIMTNDRIKGALEISKADVVDGKLLPNAEFVIKNSVKGKEVVKGKTDEKGIAKFTLEYGKYTYQEVAAPEGFVLDNKEYSFEIKENGEIVKATMTNDRIRGILEISKTDVVDGKLLPNAEFIIKDVATGKEVVKDKTNEKGLAKFTLEYGKYTYQEIGAPEGYVLDSKEYPFEIKENGEIVKVAMTNDRIKGILEISKTDLVSGKLLPNAEFIIKDVATGKEVVKGKTDEKGLAKFTLKYGKYTYQEIGAPEGYVLDSKEYPFEIKENGEIVKATMPNDRIKGMIEISKTDLVSGKLLPNAEFTIKDVATGKEVVKGKTDEKGLAKFTLEYGKYTYKEIAAPEGYVLDSKEYPFEIKENGEIVKATMTNDRIRGILEISKTDVVDGKLLPNAEFIIKDVATGKEVVKDKTNEKGLAKFTLEYGKYTYQEIAAPEGYVLDNKEYPFEIKENGEVIKVTMKNEAIIKNEVTKKPEKLAAPKTGDVGVTGAAMAGILALAGLVINNKRKKKQN